MLTKSSDPLQYLIDAVPGSVKINIPALATGHFPKDNTQSAVYFKGKSSIVFAFQLQKKLKAIKIWPVSVDENLRRQYRAIEDYLPQADLNYFAGMSYLEDAITIKDCKHDVLLMDWIGRQNVKEYIIANIDQKELLDSLAEKICCLHRDLNNAGIAHGHFHTGNIYIDANNELKLIDYDSLSIKDFTEERGLKQNYPDYCHPSFINEQRINARADYFSSLLLYLGIKAIAYNPVLWGRYKVGFQENFLFSAADFLDLKNSSVYKYLRKTGSPETDELLDILLTYCEEKDPDNLLPFYTYFKNNLQPTVSLAHEAEGKAESDLVITKISKPGNTKSMVHITMPAQVVLSETDEPRPTTEERPLQEKSFAENTLTPDFIVERLPETPVFILNNNDQRKDTAKKISATKEKPSNKNTTRPGATQKHKSLFVTTVFFIGAVIFTGIYLLGNYANSSKAITPPEAATNSQQEEDPIKKTVTEAKPDTSVNIIAVDSAAANVLSTPAPDNATPGDDSVVIEPAEAAADPLTKIVVSNSNQPMADSSVIIPGKQPGNDSTGANEQDVKNAGHKPAVVKSSTSKKQTSNSFKIGAVPKQ